MQDLQQQIEKLSVASADVLSSHETRGLFLKFRDALEAG